MLITTSGVLHEGFLLLSLGNTSRYLVAGEKRLVLVDTGLLCHGSLLEKRLISFGLGFKDLTTICFTHLHPERVLAAVVARKANPKIEIWATSAMGKRLTDISFIEELLEQDRQLSLSFNGIERPNFTAIEVKQLLQVDQHITESDVIDAGAGLTLNMHFSPGHTPESVAYFLDPYRILIADEAFGYFRGKSLVAPGGDDNLEIAISSVGKWKDKDLAGLALPNGGVLTGALISRNLSEVESNSRGLIEEVNTAKSEGMKLDEIREQVYQNLYTTESADPVLQTSLKRTFERVMSQLLS